MRIVDIPMAPLGPHWGKTVFSKPEVCAGVEAAEVCFAAAELLEGFAALFFTGLGLGELLAASVVGLGAA